MFHDACMFPEGHTYPDGSVMLPGYYNFNESGKMIILNGVVDGYLMKMGNFSIRKKQFILSDLIKSQDTMKFILYQS